MIARFGYAPGVTDDDICRSCDEVFNGSGLYCPSCLAQEAIDSRIDD